MTTSFAWFARGCLAQSWRANPAGCLIALFAVPVACWLFLCSWLERPVVFRSIDKPLIGLLVSIVAVTLAFWLIRIIGAPADLVSGGFSPWGLK
jgi:hypothetical protein